MNKWSGRTEKKTNESGIKVLWDNIKHDNLCIIRILEGEKGSKCMWRNYDWKLPKLKERNKYPGTGSTKGLNQNEAKPTHKKTYHNLKMQKLRIKREF